MNSAVERILEGNFNKDNHTLDFSTPVIELYIAEGEIYEGSFVIYGPSDVYVEGSVSSGQLRMTCPVQNFSGSESDIPFVFDSVGMSEGDEFKGDFRIISNQGEYLIPFCIKIGTENVDTSLGDIRNLFHFTNLAKTNYQEAVSLFHSRDFEKILQGSDRPYLGAYRALSQGPDDEQNLEEFLLQIKKKQPAEFLIEDLNVKIDSIMGPTEKNLVITRNGWGYSHLNISTDAAFISLGKNQLFDEDFIGNCARVVYSIDDELLHDGKNYGRIFIRNAYNDITVNVCVSKNVSLRKAIDSRKAQKHRIVDLMHYFEAFRARKISATTWMQETNSIVDALLEADKDNVAYQLMHVQLLLTAERYNEAKWILEQCEVQATSSDDATLYCYYYYLTTLINRSEQDTQRVSAMISHVYSQNMDNWRVAWLLLYLSGDYAKNPLKRWDFLNTQFRMGSSSPVILVEAYQVLINNPTVMSAITPFELAVMKYMAKKEILTPDIIEQFMYLMSRQKIHNKNYFSLLKACYRVLPNEDVLKAICTLLINTSDTSEEAFTWYQKAIEKELKITKLYEYYMMSIDMEAIVEIPKIVLMYFAFDSSLDALHNSFLYSYVYRNKALIPDLYESYKENIERFMVFELLKGNNNKYLSYLYQNMISEGMITEDVAKGLCAALFVHEIRFARKNIVSVTINYDSLTEKYTYPVNKSTIYVPLYGTNYQIMAEDSEGNRFTRDEEFTVNRLIIPDRLLSLIRTYASDNVLFDLAVCEHGSTMYSVSNANVENMRTISQSDIVRAPIRKAITVSLLNFYYDEDMMEELDTLLESLTLSDIDSSSVTSVIKTMVVRGMYEKAYEWICLCGGDNIEPKIISRLCSRLLSETDNDSEIDENIMTPLIFRAFQGGKHDENLVAYLVKHFSATSREMKEVWKVAKDYEMPVDDFEEKILNQLLYTNAFVGGIPAIFESFAQKNLRSRLVKAFVAQNCYDYFVAQKLIDSVYVDILQKMIDDEQVIPLVCKLAYTRYYADEAKNLSEKTSRTVLVFLREILADDMVFPYFKEYAKSVTFMHRFLDKTMIEYRLSPGKTATIHYMIEKNGQTASEYQKEEMLNIYEGICVKSFVLFFGERLQYYIIEHDGENDNLTESATFARNDMDEHESNSRYGMINDIAIARTLGDYGTMEDLISEYHKYEYLVRTNFTVKQ